MSPPPPKSMQRSLSEACILSLNSSDPLHRSQVKSVLDRLTNTSGGSQMGCSPST